ncbi:MAG: ATP-dependent DNA helicase RecG, partial [Solobacterium sp.]|nr:ATP-dependent DNA helicase RecG [Solobacterium sp.]
FRSILNDVNGLLASGRQLYVICAAVEDSEEYDARNVHDVAAALQKYYAGQYKVGILHGRMSSEEKQEVMRQFLENRMQILVSTTVVEVGVNVVNATGMIIYDADRFGLAQIHQLRGRVQRGREQGYCWLLTGSTDEKTMERLNVLVSTSDGFAISYEDLRLRGPGDILGTKQSGLPDFVLGNIIEDQKIINQARKDAETILQHADLPQYQRILQLVEAANADNAQFVD